MTRDGAKGEKPNPYASGLARGLPRAALLGRPNVGKSTLFNRLIRSRRAITHDRPGVTRDRLEGVVQRPGLRPFILVDTGGLSLAGPLSGPDASRGLEEDILRQVRAAVAEAGALCLVADAREGLTALDRQLADFLRRTGKPLLLAVNKVDSPEKAELALAEFHALGLDLVPCSAEHGHNLGALLEELAARLPVAGPVSPTPVTGESAGAGDGAEAGAGAELVDEPAALRLALLGRPNVGKSSLANALAGEERMIVSPEAGTTRDSVDVPVLPGMISAEAGDAAPCILVDSAGVRRPSRVADELERFSVNSALKSSGKAQLTLLVLDAAEGLTQQDKRLLELLDGRKIPFMVLLNKIDLLDKARLKELEKDCREALAYCPHAPLLLVSAHEGRNLRKIFPLARAILRESRLRMGTGQLNRLLEELLQERQPPLIKGRRAKFHYLTQAESAPPTFVFFVNDPTRINQAYARYLERGLRLRLGLKHAPVRVKFRGRSKE